MKLLPCLLYLTTFVVSCADFTNFSVSCMSRSKCKIQKFRNDHSLATFVYRNDSEKYGFDQIEIYTHLSSKNTDDYMLALAAGFGEGVATASKIATHYQNLVIARFGSLKIDEKVIDYAKENIKFVEQNLEANPHSPYFIQASLFLRMAEGFSLGYNYTNPSLPLSDLEILILNYHAEWGDIQSVKEVSSNNHNKSNLNNNNINVKHSNSSNYEPDWFNLSKNKVLTEMFKRVSCSAAVKILPDHSELFIAHTTWLEYRTMTRIYKHYHLLFNFASPVIVSFSSYPAALSSIDDFYINPSLVVTETTTPTFIPKNSTCVNSDAVPTWLRAIVSNSLAHSGKEWADHFVKYNSGVYNNQWIILDYSLFTPFAPLPKNLLWVVEVLPCFSHAEDLTHLLTSNLHFASFNMPFYNDTDLLSGMQDMRNKFGSAFSHDKCARSLIFERDLPQVNSISDIQKLMRSNQYRSDPLSQGQADFVIAARHDLVEDRDIQGSVRCCGGATDAKVTSSKLWQDQMSAMIIYGPPFNDEAPPFDFSTSIACNNTMHFGMPDVFKFDWIKANRVKKMEIFENNENIK